MLSCWASRRASRLRAAVSGCRRRIGLWVVRRRGGTVGAFESSPSAGVKRVSLDVFDTCVGRAVWSPVDVFRLAAAAALNEDVTAPGVASLVEARQRAEAEARRRSDASDIDLAQIYAVMAETVTADELNRFEAAEIDTERRYSVPRYDTRRGALAAVAGGVEVGYLSDMYLSSTFIAELLDNAGFPPGEVTVSSETGSSKADGSAYDILKPARPHEVLHVGDNVRADGLAALDHQVDSQIVDPANLTYRAAPAQYRVPIPPPLGDGILLAISANTALEVDAGEHSPELVEAWRVGATVFGPLIVSFACDLADRLTTDTVALFSSRDMRSTREVFARRAPGHRHHYVELSRRSLALPALAGGIRPTDRDLLVGGRGALTERELWTRIGLEPPAGRRDIDRPRTVTERDDVWEAFLSDSDRIVTYAGRELAEFRTFWLHQQLPVEGRATLVDVGWRATVQYLLVRALKSSDFDLALDGRYLALLEPAPPGVQASGWQVDSGVPASGRRSFEAGIPLVELGLQADEGTVLGYSDGDAVRGPRVERREVQTMLQAAAGTVAGRWLALAPPVAPSEVSVRPLLRLLSRPTRAEAVALGTMLHTDRLGSSNELGPILPPPKQARRMLLSRRAGSTLRGSEWRPGLLAAAGAPAWFGVVIDAGLRGLKSLGRIAVSLRSK